MTERRLFPVLFSIFFLVFCLSHGRRGNLAAAGRTPVSVPVGVVLDFKTSFGRMSTTSISLALEDFYSVHANYTTRLRLHTRDSKTDVIGAASAALDLMKNVRVQAIMGPVTSSQAEFIVNLGNKTKVPIVSFSATSPSLSPAQSPYFVRTALDDSSQVRCIASILKLFGWRQVVPIYEDTRYGRGIIPYLVDALQDIDGRIPYRSVIQPSASDDKIKEELLKLKTMSTRVFVVHMSLSLASRLFLLASENEMIEDEYVWIVTDGMTNLLGSMNTTIIESMQGVLGVRPYVPKSPRLADFTRRWRRKYQEENPDEEATEPSLYSLWAYDTVWALAMAEESLGVSKPGFQSVQIGNDSTDLGALEVSQSGPDLLKAINKVRFEGLAGEFHLVNGQLQPSGFQIININGKGGRNVGFWMAEKISRWPSSRGKIMQQASSTDLPIIWPGERRYAPKGWVIPTSGKKLRIGVPVKDGFNEFMKVERNVNGNQTEITGFCVDVFDSVMKIMPYNVPYKYVPFEDVNGKSAGSYNDLVNQVAEQGYDAVVGDTTILANRSRNVDFTLPFTESGWTMVVLVKENNGKSGWIFVKPWRSDLWIASFAFFVFTGFVVWMIEHRVNPAFRGHPTQHLGRSFYFTFSTMVFSHRENVESNFSRLVIIVWVFVVLILQSSFTANLASLLTIQKLEPAFTDVQELLNGGHNVGYQEGSFVYNHLKEHLHFDETRIKKYENPDQYAEALSKGTYNGGVSAIFDEVPYIKVFLSKYCSNYTMAGPVYKADGFGFVFPKGSPLVRDVSSAILTVTEEKTMRDIEKKWFGDKTVCKSEGSHFSSGRLTLKSFEGLFFITGAVSTASLLLFLGNFFFQNRKKVSSDETEDSVWKRATSRAAAWAKHYDKMSLPKKEWSRRVRDVPSQEERPRGDVEEDNSLSSHGRNSLESVSRTESEVSYSSEMESPRMPADPPFQITVAR
ncbi:unnamed protein product [Spirodela intermedia]|uniref:Glutamate receptor n=1 Tax=Spirodela intermedia TaxID=51605 RepID=A0A7I8LHG4_SPIIN|nr:unnamed protein product [Spirodela intermedia]